MPTRLIALMAASLLLGMATAYFMVPGIASRTRLSSPPAATGVARVGGPFSLVDPSGKTVTDADFRGRFMLVYFGYTYCPDICPAGLQVISAALDKLGPKAEKIVPVFITLDPERDTPAKMGEYVRSFHPRLVGLSGSAAEIAKVAKSYRVYWKKVADEKAPEAYTLDHTSIIYLMSPSGEFLAHFTHATQVDQLAARLAEKL